MGKEQSSLNQKPRYEVLDGLRGVAALIVLLYHHFEMYSGGDPAAAVVNHGYLAVDFFFILSGYVIGYAYDDRWGKMSVWTFLKRRVFRLHPMIVFATVLGAALFYVQSDKFFDPQNTPGMIASCPLWKLLAASVLGVLMIPMPIAWDIRGWNEIAPVNGNAWTLYYEYLANLLYGLFIRRFRTWALALFVGACAVLTLNLGLNWDLFGTFSTRTTAAFTMIGGWELSAQEVTIGFSRLLYPFFAGLLLSRLGASLKVRGGFWCCSAILAALLVCPRVGGHAHPLWNGLYETAVVLAAFPLVVTLGAGSSVTGRSAVVCKWLGEISYPLYIVQYPIVFGLVGSWKAEHPAASLTASLFVNAVGFLASVAIAQLALTFYDKPVRRATRFSRNGAIRTIRASLSRLEAPTARCRAAVRQKRLRRRFP